MQHATPLENDDFDGDTLRRPGVWLVDFSARWCPPCRVLETVLDPLAAQYAGRLQVGEIDTDDEPDVTARFGITAAPTMLIFKDGVLAGRRMGAAPKGVLVRWLEEFVGPDHRAPATPPL
jgi:thioredoxin 1